LRTTPWSFTARGSWRKRLGKRIIERAYGSFYRSFTLPNHIDQDKIQAEHENGVLKITMPKKPELQPRKVKILKPKGEETSKK